MKFLVETSARHVHVTKETLETLFGKGFELTVKKELSQPGQYASEQRVTVVGPKKELANVSILGPCRNADQVELSASDARSIGIAAPVRESGDIAGSGACKLVGPCGEVELKEGVIVAKRHIHVAPEDAEKLGVQDKEDVYKRQALSWWFLPLTAPCLRPASTSCCPVRLAFPTSLFS